MTTEHSKKSEKKSNNDSNVGRSGSRPIEDPLAGFFVAAQQFSLSVCLFLFVLSAVVAPLAFFYLGICAYLSMVDIWTDFNFPRESSILWMTVFGFSGAISFFVSVGFAILFLNAKRRLRTDQEKSQN